MRIAREAWPFVLPFVAAAAALAALERPLLAAGSGAVGLLVAAFFRVPSRPSRAPADAVVSAANGVVTAIEPCDAPEVGPGRYVRIVTFLSVFDVHVQRAPCDGTVVAAERFRGRKVAAFRPDAGEVNESFRTVLETPAGDRVGIVQIAGLLARRIVPYGRPGTVFGRGDLIGLIRFGSRVDVLLPEPFEVTVAPKDRLREGETVIARRRDR